MGPVEVADAAAAAAAAVVDRVDLEDRSGDDDDKTPFELVVVD